MERTGLNRNFALSLFNTLFHGFPEYVSGRTKEADTDADSCLNAVLFLWYNIEHHFDGKSQHGAFTVFLRNKYDWNIPKGLLPEQIVETESESRSITLDFNLTNIPPVSDLLYVLNSLYALSISTDRYKDPYDEKWYKEENALLFQGSNTVYIGFPTKQQKCEHVFLSLTEMEKDFEGLPWDYGDMSEAQKQYIKDLRAYLGLDKDEYKSPFLSSVQLAELESYRKVQLESIRAMNALNESKIEAEYGNRTNDTSEDMNPDKEIWIQIATHLVDKGILKNRTVNNKTVYCPNGTHFRNAQTFNNAVKKYTKENRIPLKWDDNRHTPLSVFISLGLLYPPKASDVYTDSEDFQKRYLNHKYKKVENS